MIQTFGIKIINPQFGELLNEKFIDGIQFKLFLKMIQGTLELKNDLTFFNGVDFLIHIPYTILVGSMILTNITSDVTMTDIVKSKIEALVTK
jgi:hypothetical protein